MADLRNLRIFMVLASILLVGACSNSAATDGSTAANVGSAGKAGSVCSTSTQNQGCFNGVKMVCAGTTWQLLGQCQPTEICTESVDPSNKSKLIATCKVKGSADAVSFGDSSGLDGSTLDTSTSDGSTDVATQSDIGTIIGSCGDGFCNTGETSQSCPEDCPLVVTVCGNGSCDKGETSVTCPADCGNTGGGGGGCGDLVCTAPETMNSCAIDCDPANTCLNTKCGTEYKACLGDSSCLDLLKCLSACKTGDMACENGCATSAGQGALDLYNAVGQCYKGAGCGSSGGGAGCGDMVCTAPEDANSCAFDCNPTNICIFQACASQSSGCIKNAKCNALIGCLNQCAATDNACQQACGTTAGTKAIGLYNTLGKCIQSSGCDASGGGGGSNVCDAGCDSPNQVSTSSTGKPCYCDNQCAQYGDCCSADGKSTGKTCAGSTCASCNGSGTSGPVCGDGTCDSGETTANCPKDCPATTTCTTYSDVQTIFKNSCSGSGCHSGFATSCPSQYQQIGMRVASGNMPIGKKLSSADKAKIAAWVKSSGACTTGDCP